MLCTKEHLDLITPILSFLNLDWNIFVHSYLNLQQKNILVHEKVLGSTQQSNSENSAKSANSELKKFFTKSSQKRVTTNVRILSLSLVIVYSDHLDTPDFNYLLTCGDYLSAAQFVLKMLALKGNLCLSDLSLLHIRLQLSVPHCIYS